MHGNRCVTPLPLVLVALVFESAAAAQPCPGNLCPRFDWDPEGEQTTRVALYVASRDEYLLASNERDGLGGGPVGRFLDPAGGLGPVMTLVPGNEIVLAAMAYNLDRDEILVVTRDEDPPTLRGVFLDSSGQPLASPFLIDSGNAPQVAYSPDSGRYLVTWSRLGSEWATYYALIDSPFASPPSFPREATPSKLGPTRCLAGCPRSLRGCRSRSRRSIIWRSTFP